MNPKFTDHDHGLTAVRSTMRETLLLLPAPNIADYRAGTAHCTAGPCNLWKWHLFGSWTTTRGARRASVLIGQLRDMLGGEALRIEHIGSTAIPMMDANDVLDVQVSVADLDLAVERFDEPLTAMGFERLSYAHDHVPAGRQDDPAQWAKRFWWRRSQRARET